MVGDDTPDDRQSKPAAVAARKAATDELAPDRRQFRQINPKFRVTVMRISLKPQSLSSKQDFHALDTRS